MARLGPVQPRPIDEHGIILGRMVGSPFSMFHIDVDYGDGGGGGSPQLRAPRSLGIELFLGGRSTSSTGYDWMYSNYYVPSSPLAGLWLGRGRRINVRKAFVVPRDEEPSRVWLLLHWAKEFVARGRGRISPRVISRN